MDENVKIFYDEYNKRKNNTHNLLSVLLTIIDNLINQDFYDESLPLYSQLECNAIRFRYTLSDKLSCAIPDTSYMISRNLLTDKIIEQKLEEIDNFQQEIITFLKLYKSSIDDYNKLDRYAKYAITSAINNPYNCKSFRDHYYTIPTLINPDNYPHPLATFSKIEFKKEIELFKTYRNDFVLALNFIEDIDYKLTRLKKYKDNIPPYSQIECNVIRLCGIVNGYKYPGRQTIFIHACDTNNKEVISQFLSELPKWTTEMTHLIKLYEDNKNITPNTNNKLFYNIRTNSLT